MSVKQSDLKSDGEKNKYIQYLFLVLRFLPDKYAWSEKTIHRVKYTT